MLCSRSEPISGCPLVALPASQHMTKNTVAAFPFDRPGSIRPRWVMAHMLVVPAFELGDPITHFVLMKADNSLVH